MDLPASQSAEMLRRPSPASSPCSALAGRPRESSVPDQIGFHAKRFPNSLAVAFGETSITFGDLDARTDQLSLHLRGLGVTREVVVGICLPQSIDFVVGALAVLKAGGAYLPLDPSRPLGRLAFQLADSDAKFLLVSSDFNASFAHDSCRPTLVSLDDVPVAKASSAQPAAQVRGEDLAYVIYTSGSTGRPKGVEIEHSGLNNLVAWHRLAFELTSADRASQISSVEFDAAVWELWPHLAAGASVHIPDKFVAKDPALFQNWLLANQVTIGFAPSPLAEHLMSMAWPSRTPLRILLTGADVLHRYPPARLPFHVVNNYGPTECTVVSTSGLLPPGGGKPLLPPLGLPIDGVQVHVLDENNQTVSRGRVGEIWIAGLGLARGYRGDPSSTASKFLPNPFSSAPDSRMYRTGDLGRVLPDGQLAFVGRVDDQIKISGYRIEPAEIEAVLNGLPAVRESAVVLCNSPLRENRLIAYISADPSLSSFSEVRAAVSRSLPDYMIPSAIVALPVLPRTSSGKIDRAALRSLNPLTVSRTDPFVAPRTPIERRLVEILAPLLKLEEISIEDNFFTLGGHSLLGTQFIARIRDVFAVEITLRFLFESPTIAAIARQVESLLLLRIAQPAAGPAQPFPKFSSVPRGGV